MSTASASPYFFGCCAGERSLESARLSCTATVFGGHPQRQYTETVYLINVSLCRGGMVRAVIVPLVETGGLSGGKAVAAPLTATASHSRLNQPDLPSILGSTSSRASSSGVFFLPMFYEPSQGATAKGCEMELVNNLAKQRHPQSVSTSSWKSALEIPGQDLALSPVRAKVLSFADLVRPLLASKSTSFIWNLENDVGPLKSAVYPRE